MKCTACWGSGKIYYYLSGEYEVTKCDHLAEKVVPVFIKKVVLH
jgi:hypothetical protein